VLFIEAGGHDAGVCLRWVLKSAPENIDATGSHYTNRRCCDLDCCLAVCLWHRKAVR
jgi:hypothetical protein